MDETPVCLTISYIFKYHLMACVRHCTHENQSIKDLGMTDQWGSLSRTRTAMAAYSGVLRDILTKPILFLSDPE